ncbi:MAG: DUF2207 family protein [Acidimicrobiia bacterium]
MEDPGLVERWRDLGPVLWLIASGAAVLWAALLGALAFATRCRDVDPGPATLDLGGPEPPAVVNLITDGWRLGHEAVPATLLDLAARRLVDIDQVGDRTLVRLRRRAAAPAAGDLQPYERLVLDHVESHATDGVVPAEALTTGPENEARGWWRSFRKAVERDARARGLSRRRWSPAAHLTLTVAALAVAAFVAVAATTLPDDPDDEEDDPIGAALAFGFITAGGLIALVEGLNGERDTPAGRAVAGRWLGLRAMLGEDPLFAEYPPAGVAIWDRLLAYGAAMGVAHGAVRALPLGAESDTEAWSSVGGHWRVVRIRYPRFVPPGYGRHPGLVAALGAFQVGLAVLLYPVASGAADAVRDLVTDFSSDQTVPPGVRIGIGVAFGAIAAAGAIIGLRGASMALTGLSDLVTARRTAEGRVLRVRRRGSDERARWYVAVDEGAGSTVRAWQTSPGAASQGATVRAEVTRWLGHVRNLQVVAAAAPRPSLPADGPDDEPSPLAALLGRTGAGVAATPTEPVPAEPGPPPPLPDAGAVSAAIGRPLARDDAAPGHPLAAGRGSATFTGEGGAMVQVVWVEPALLTAYRSMPRILRRRIDGVGDEAYRAVIGGGLVARRGSHVLMVTGRLPGASDGDRNRAFAAVARAALATA